MCFQRKAVPLDSLLQGEMLEWLKRHAWKACIRQKRIPGSNPGLSAKCERRSHFLCKNPLTFNMLADFFLLAKQRTVRTFM